MAIKNDPKSDDANSHIGSDGAHTGARSSEDLNRSMPTARITRKPLMLEDKIRSVWYIAARLAGPAGLLLLATSAITFLLIGKSANVWFWGKIIIALVLLLIYVIADFHSFMELVRGRRQVLQGVRLVQMFTMLVLLFSMNIVLIMYPIEWDATKDKIHTLHQQTVEVLAKLEQPVQIYAFFKRSHRSFNFIKELLEKYQARSTFLSYSFVDPELSPHLVSKYMIKEDGPLMILLSGDKQLRIDTYSEESLTNALLSLQEGDAKTIYFLTGHGEADIESDKERGYQLLSQTLKHEGYLVKSFSLLTAEQIKQALMSIAEKNLPGYVSKKSVRDTIKLPDSIELKMPEDIDLLVIAGPKSSFFEKERAAILDYLRKGGRLLLMLDWEHDGGLNTLLNQYSLNWGNDLIIDGTLETQPLSVLGVRYDSKHPITSPYDPKGYS
jgi:hypothetical protein